MTEEKPTLEYGTQPSEAIGWIVVSLIGAFCCLVLAICVFILVSFSGC